MMVRTRLYLLFSLIGVATGAFSAEPVRTVLPAADKREDAQRSSSTPAKTAVPEKPADRLDLDVSVVTGNRELPKVLYIVPWKKAELGDLPEQPFNSLLDETLKPIDRDEFRREVTYFSKLAERTAGSEAAAAGKSPNAPTTSR